MFFDYYWRNPVLLGDYVLGFDKDYDTKAEDKSNKLLKVGKFYSTKKLNKTNTNSSMIYLN